MKNSNSTFNFLNPDYIPVIKRRVRFLKKIRSDATNHPQNFIKLKNYYACHIDDFITDWGMTFDPRNTERNIESIIPFILFPRQREFINEMYNSWRAGNPMIVEKSRDMGVSWLCVAFFCSLAIFYRNSVFGFGSRKEELVDRRGDMGSLLEKGRMFIENLPVEFRGGFERSKHSKEKYILIPNTNSVIKGESGDNIGRGDRTSAYCVDEAAHIERAQLLEASLSNTTNFRIDVSTPKGMGNVFAEKRFSGKYNVFTFRWQDDPRKDESWYNKKKLELDPVTFAQEIDLDYSGSVEGVLIPSIWVEAAVDAHVKLKFEKSGEKFCGLDIADEGKDLNAMCVRHGSVLELCEEWSGKNSDILHTVENAILKCQELECKNLNYDCEGLGAGVRGDEKELQKKYKTSIYFNAFRSSASVLNPENKTMGIKNIDLFANLKSQSWWALRERFLKTFRSVKEGEKFNADELISIPSYLSNLHKIKSEISQPRYEKNGNGKIVIKKTPEGFKSPNIADSLMMCYTDKFKGINLTNEALKAFGVY